MRISRPKSQFIDCKFGQDNGQGREPVKIIGEELQRVHHFKYLSSSVEETGGMTTEISQRVSAAWRNWKRCSGVLCDRRMPVKLNGKVYKMWSGQLCCIVQKPGRKQGDKKHDEK